MYTTTTLAQVLKWKQNMRNLSLAMVLYYFCDCIVAAVSIIILSVPTRGFVLFSVSAFTRTYVFFVDFI